MHSHLYLKKRKRAIVLNNSSIVYSVKYECMCGDWWVRQILKGQDIPSIWNWEIFSDEPIKLENIPQN